MHCIQDACKKDERLTSICRHLSHRTHLCSPKGPRSLLAIVAVVFLIGSHLFATSHASRHPTTCEHDRECATNDANQYQHHSMCLRGFCTRVCSWSSPRDDDDEQCTLFHCDAKSLMLVGAETTPALSIQTNSYPQLERYMSGAKCSWIVKPSYSNNSNTPQQTHLLAFTYERFATHLANDLLYIFAGDSLASPLIAILSGGGEQQLPPHAKPARSLSTGSTPFLLVDTRLTPTLFFLFKADTATDIIRPASQQQQHLQSPEFQQEHQPRPSGVSIRYELISALNSSSASMPEVDSLLEPFVGVDDDYSDSADDLLSSRRLRRALACSFMFEHFLYVVGGYSFASSLPNNNNNNNNNNSSSSSSNSEMSFVSRFDLGLSTWSHVNKTASSEWPDARYGHSCALDASSRRVFMFGGVKHASGKWRTATNELWSYDLDTNRWTLLAPNRSDTHGVRLPLAVSGHSMHMSGDGSSSSRSLLAFFGYSHQHESTLRIIQEFNIGNLACAKYKKKKHQNYHLK